MAATLYAEPLVSFLVLDFDKPVESRLLLESIRDRTQFAHKTIYLHNGRRDAGEEYGYQYLRDGLIDQFIQTRVNHGLGVGTRDLFSACFSPWAVYAQNDQILARDFEVAELQEIIGLIGTKTAAGEEVASVSLAGPVCGEGVYTERAHLISAGFYRHMEMNVGLPCGGAGPYHHEPWREGAIQRYYKDNGYTHLTSRRALFMDNGREAKRQNPDGSRWMHYPDTKSLFLLSGPVTERYIYPYLTEQEWDQVIATQSWPPGQIPEREKGNSFHVWH